ncbi:hypothetical protein BDY24DRAFT_379978 [Mrakia frigida]|uniref:uncharacterized protein n=1 Tax=Mrakia frigida TaxID=29902 RepID=UPI003FCC182C
MRGIVDEEWEGIDFEDGGEVGKWLSPQERNPQQSQLASTSSSSSPTSSPWDVDPDSDSDEDGTSHHPPSAQPHPSSSRFNASPEPEPFPPFSVAHLLQVRSLDIYARKVIQGAVKDRLNGIVSSATPSSSSGGGAKPKRITGSFARDFGGRELVGLGRAEQRVLWKKRLNGKGGEGSEWRREKKQELMEQTVHALVREGEVFVVLAQQQQQPLSNSSSFNKNDSTPKPNRRSTNSKPKPSPSLSLYLPTCLATLGPLLFQLLRIESDRLRAASKPRIPGIRAPTNWVKTETLVRRLQSTEERWYFVGEAVVRGVLERLDNDMDLLEEECSGKGWRVVG